MEGEREGLRQKARGRRRDGDTNGREGERSRETQIMTLRAVQFCIVQCSAEQRLQEFQRGQRGDLLREARDTVVGQIPDRETGGGGGGGS